MSFDFNDIQILNEFEEILNNKRNQIDQQLLLTILTKLLFCIFKNITQLPSILKEQFNNISKQLNNKNSALQNIQNQLTLIQMSNNSSELTIQKKLETFESHLNNKISFINNSFDSIQNQISQSFQQIKTLNDYQTNTTFPNIEEEPKNYQSNIFNAYIEGKLSSVQWIIQNDYSSCINIKERYREKTPLHYACENGHLPVVEYLLSKGAKIEERAGNQGKTPLHFACENGHLPIVECLISKGANVEAKAQFYEKTPLHFACEKGYLQIIECLLTKRSPYSKEVANINSKDNEGKTPLQYAYNYGNVVVAKYLISMGAKQ